MLLLTLRTDKPEAEIGLFEDERQLAYITWPAHRELAETMHLKIKKLMEGPQKTLNELEGIIAYRGPGSFTGLRIGLSVANTLSYSLELPITAETGSDWIDRGRVRLKKGDSDQLAMPKYGAPPHITAPKK